MTGLLAGCLSAAAVAAEPAEIRARFIGNMALQLTDGQVTLRTDFPCESGYSGYMTWSDALVPPAAGAAACLVTHSHRDHFLAAVVSPWLLRAATKGGRRIDARRIVVYHHEKDEAVPDIQGREQPRQGDELVFLKQRP